MADTGRVVPPFEKVDPDAVDRAVRAFVPMLRRRGWFLMADAGAPAHRVVRRAIEALLDGLREDDPVRDEHSPLWARVEPSGLVLVGVARRAFIVGVAKPRGGLAQRLLVR